MKKIFTTVSIFCGLISAFAQNYTPSKTKNERKADYSVSVRSAEVDNIDWKSIKDFFADKKENDSVKISVRVIEPQMTNLKTEKKYTTQGIVKNINELISVLKNMLK